METADLHIHTLASDGCWSIEKIINRAAALKISAIAITDHDTIDSLEKLTDLKTSASLQIVPGIEFNTDADALEIHILGYFIDIEHKALRKILADLSNSREDRVREMAGKLTKLGYPLEFADIKRQAGSSKALGRPHVAAALIAKGYFSCANEVLRGLIAKGGAAYVAHYKLSPVQAIETVLEAGGIPVAAHPGLIHDDIYLHKLISRGLMGLEAYHPKHDKAAANHYNQIARNNNLIVTGGSDFHGIPGRYPEDLGQFSIPYHLFAALNERHQLRI